MWYCVKILVIVIDLFPSCLFPIVILIHIGQWVSLAVGTAMCIDPSLYLCVPATLCPIKLGKLYFSAGAATPALQEQHLSS